MMGKAARWGAWAPALGLCLCLGAATAAADPQSQSFSTWTLEDTLVKARFSVAARELTRLGPWRDMEQLGQHLLEHLSATVGVGSAPLSGACPLEERRLLAAAPGVFQAELEFRCASPPTGLVVEIGAFFPVASSHIHFARFHWGEEQFESLFTRRQQRHEYLSSVAGGGDDAAGGAWQEQGGAAGWQVLWVYLRLGTVHILEGIDHVAFLLTLLLLSLRWRHVVWLVTGFTLGHSVTLSLAVLGIVDPNEAVVESLIGFTILLVAVENIAAREGIGVPVAITAAALVCLCALLGAFAGLGPPWLGMLGLALFTLCYLWRSGDMATVLRLRPFLTALFGMVHGFGFANVLLELGMPAGRLAPALFGFNLGVEVGQILIVCVLLAACIVLRRLLRRRPDMGRLGQELLSCALCALGTFWFLGRAYFG